MGRVRGVPPPLDPPMDMDLEMGDTMLDTQRLVNSK